jgi:type II secretory pathway pseudopilin PulG
MLLPNHYKIIIKNGQSGFTLIEVLLYLGLSILMTSLVSGIGINVLTSLVNVKAESELQYNSQFINEKIRPYITEAKGIELPLVGATSSVLVLSMDNQDKNPTTIDIFDGRLRVREGDDEFEFFSGENILLSDIEFTNVTYDGGLGSLRIVLPMMFHDPSNRRIFNSSTTLSATINIKYP